MSRTPPYSLSGRPDPTPERPPTPELHDLIVEAMGALPDGSPLRVHLEAQRRQRARQIQTEHEITGGMVLYVWAEATE